MTAGQLLNWLEKEHVKRNAQVHIRIAGKEYEVTSAGHNHQTDDVDLMVFPEAEPPGSNTQRLKH